LDFIIGDPSAKIVRRGDVILLDVPVCGVSANARSGGSRVMVHCVVVDCACWSECPDYAMAEI